MANESSYISSMIHSDLGLDLSSVKDATQKPIKVFVRTRPLLSKEIVSGDQNILTVLSSEKQILIEGGVKGTFTYDGVFDENASQQDVFQQVVRPILPLLNDGNNVTIIAYGQTGSGKTYSMGTDRSHCQDDEGILQRAIKTLLEETKIPKKSSTPTKEAFSKTKTLKITFLEIYNATIYDLFSCREIVNTKHDGAGGIIPVGCHEEIAYTVEEALSLLNKGNSLRQMTPTVMNSCSSRSHALISVVVSQKNGLSGCLRLVDLAGAEGVGRNQMEGKGFSEGVSINKGLLAIGKVLASIYNKDSYIPYRDSMLTRLLRDALGGNSYTSLLVCVNPTSSNVSVTTNTLHFAEQARNVKTKPLGMSTIKRKGIKRPSEDVSATPSAFKRYVQGNEKLGHNATISTPGYKPPLSKFLKLNNTFVTPLNKGSLSVKPWNISVQTELPPVPTFPHLEQPIFEEDSPTHSIIEPLPMGNVTFQMSPFAEKVQAKFEESMRQYDEKMTMKMKQMGIQIAQTMMEGLMNGGRKSMRLLKKQDNVDKSFSTPTSEVKKENTDVFPSLPEVIEQVVTRIMSNKENSIFCNALVNETKFQHSSSSRVPFQEISNLSNYQVVGGIKANNNVSTSNDIKKPSKLVNKHLTSTAICENKLVRKSARLSSRLNSNNTLLHSNNIANLSILQDTAISDIDFSSTMENTILFNGASPALAGGHSRSFHSNLTVNTESRKAIHDESTLIYIPEQETIWPMQPDHIPSEDILGQPLFLDSTIGSRIQPVLPRRTTRKSALIAMQKNHALLSNASPFASKRNSSSKTLALSSSMAKKTTNKSPMQRGNCKWELIISPTLKMNQEKEILCILNSGNLMKLQKLPTVGPKTAMVIQNFRSAYGKFKKVDNLKDVPGLPKSYYSRFMKANLVSQIEFK